MAGEQGVEVDEAGFEAAMEATKAGAEPGKLSTDDWVQVHDDSETTFVGYDAREANAASFATGGESQEQAVLPGRPRHHALLPRRRWSVGDAGTSPHPVAASRLRHQERKSLIVHFVNELPADVNATFVAHVKVPVATTPSATTRRPTSCTKPCAKCGHHVEQKGSLVKAESLRFDFSHFSKVTDEELAEVEAKVNAKILANHPLVEHRAISMEEAKASGAMMLFGEKYGDEVRMIEFDSSKELCGGTHAPATGALGSFRITQETAVASGIRRIEAITGSAALQAMNSERTALQAIKSCSRHLPTSRRPSKTSSPSSQASKKNWMR